MKIGDMVVVSRTRTRGFGAKVYGTIKYISHTTIHLRDVVCDGEFLLGQTYCVGKDEVKIFWSHD